MNYAYSWGAAVVILGALFKLTHIPGANAMLFIGMGTEVLVFFISGFDRPAALKQEEEELGRLDVAEDGELDEGGEEDVSQYFASRLKNSYGQHAYAPKLFERFDLLHDEIPLQSDTALRKRTGADLRASYGELEESAAALRSVMDRMAKALSGVDLGDERKARKLSDAIRRLASDIEFLAKKWNGDAK